MIIVLLFLVGCKKMCNPTIHSFYKQLLITSEDWERVYRGAHQTQTVPYYEEADRIYVCSADSGLFVVDKCNGNAKLLFTENVRFPYFFYGATTQLKKVSKNHLLLRYNNNVVLLNIKNDKVIFNLAQRTIPVSIREIAPPINNQLIISWLDTLSKWHSLNVSLKENTN
jgi:hypothetical protein